MAISVDDNLPKTVKREVGSLPDFLPLGWQPAAFGRERHLQPVGWPRSVLWGWS